MLSYNTSRHEGTKFTPCELVMGKLARTPGSDPPVEGLDRTYLEYYTQLIDQLNRFQAMGIVNLNNSKVRSKFYYDKKAKPQTIQEGDSVYVLKEPTTKLGDQYTGPHQVVKVCGSRNLSQRMVQKTRIVHVDKVRKDKARAPTQKIQAERQCVIYHQETIMEWNSWTVTDRKRQLRVHSADTLQRGGVTSPPVAVTTDPFLFVLPKDLVSNRPLQGGI